MANTLAQSLAVSLSPRSYRSRAQLKILFVTSAQGGRQEWMPEPEMIPLYLRERGHRIQPFVLGDPSTQRAGAWSMAGSLFSRAAAIWRLGKVLRLERYDLIFTEGAEALRACRWAMTGGVPRRPALICHLPEISGWPRNWMTRRALRSQLVSRVIVSSQAVRQSLTAHGIAPERVSVVTAGVDAFAYRPANTYESARAAIDIAPEAPLVCAVGEPSRNPEAFAAFFEAFGRVRDRMDGVKAVIVSAADRSDLMSQLETHGLLRDVVCVEPGATTRHFLSASDVAVCLTDEGEGQTLARIMACVCPVIAMKNTDPLGWIHHGETGFMIRDNNPISLAAAIVWALQHPVTAEEIALAGRRRIEQTCSQEACALQLERVFLSALKA